MLTVFISFFESTGSLCHGCSSREITGVHASTEFLSGSAAISKTFQSVWNPLQLAQMRLRGRLGFGLIILHHTVLGPVSIHKCCIHSHFSVINCCRDVWEEIGTSDWSSATETGGDSSALICHWNFSGNLNKNQFWFVIFWFSCVAQLKQTSADLAAETNRHNTGVCALPVGLYSVVFSYGPQI